MPRGDLGDATDGGTGESIGKGFWAKASSPKSRRMPPQPLNGSLVMCPAFTFAYVAKLN